jgi:aldehyde dehydrogenase (NAD+)
MPTITPNRLTELLTTMEYGPSPESLQPAKDWLKQHADGFGVFINNQFGQPHDVFDTVNPANGQPLAQITQASTAEVDAAVAAARAALGPWQALSGHQRARVLYALARLLQKHSRLFAVLETLDNGKPIREARDLDIPLAARHFSYHAGWAQLVPDELAAYRPVGVVGQIVPWNFPLLMLAWKIAPALACGNTVVFKPAEWTSLTALLFAEICQQAQVPPGVINIVTGDGAVGQALVEHPGIDKLAFTGSTEVGRLIRRASAGSGKKLSLELGGKSPYLVFADADLDGAIEGLVDSIWFNQGQVCCAGSRLLVQESIFEAFIARLKLRMQTLRLGPPEDKSTDVGTLVSREQWQRVSQLVENARQEGCAVWQPGVAGAAAGAAAGGDVGDRASGGDLGNRRDSNGAVGNAEAAGCFYPPTLILGASTSANVAQTEIFGPVLVASSFRTPQEAISLANNTVYGLAACVWSESISLALDIAPQLKAGVVWLNSANLFDASSGFGGVKESGFGREGGREGLLEYLVAKAEDARPAAPLFDAPQFDGADAVDGPAGNGVANTTAGHDALAALAIDRTAKLYIGGAQARPDSGYSRAIYGPAQNFLADVPEGNRKDIRNAVEAAHKQSGWAKATAHNRSQVLYFIAENLAARKFEFAQRLQAMTGSARALHEVETSIERLFYYAAWADKWDGQVHRPPMHGISVALQEPVGIIGIICPHEAPLLGFISLIAPALALGNRVIAVPSECSPLAALDFYQVLDTSDLPGGALNIISGSSDELATTLAEHHDIDAIWRHDGSSAGCREVEQRSASSLKRTWVSGARGRDWFDPVQGQGQSFLQHASQVKNIWLPYGV